ncbi:MAG: DEAD/DEAH box helicase [bacterium]|nr:DEAD/DEAH box helicase [bacterium]
MIPAVTLRSIPASITLDLLKAILDGNRVQWKKVILESESSGGQTAHVWLHGGERAVRDAMRNLEECEVEDRILTVGESDEDAIQRLKDSPDDEPARADKRDSSRNGDDDEDESTDLPEALHDLSQWRLPFNSLGLSPELMKNVEAMGFETTTPIQGAAIHSAIEGNDVIGRAQTGSGKTLAFAIPMIERLKDRPGKGLRGLVVAPTRELAVQITEVIDKLIEGTGLKSIAIYGGDHILDQIVQLKDAPDILIATPGRLLDLQSRGRFRIDSAEIIVLDEADRMLDMGFMPQIKNIFSCFYEKPQVLLFSATLVEEIQKMRVVQLKDPVFVDVGAPDLTPLKAVAQEVIRVKSKEEKEKRLRELLRQEQGPTIVFVATKRETEMLCQRLKREGFHATRIHGDIDQSDRLKAVDLFKQGRYSILVATDVASRGLDIEGIAHVINYDLAMSPEDHIHRIGRTARAGAAGKATTLIDPRDARQFHEFKQALGQK